VWKSNKAELEVLRHLPGRLAVSLHQPLGLCQHLGHVALVIVESNETATQETAQHRTRINKKLVDFRQFVQALPMECRLNYE
jgi:predicted patatin/cPLA2 family phospholipase